MSREIDERVVEMRFDNRQFESGVQTSLSTLDRLKKGLNLDGAAKGLDQLGTAAKKCDMSMLGRSVETVQAKFSAFEVVAMTALSNITNSAVNAGKRLLSSLTIEPISTGFNEYELKMGSIQTIMASTGESLDKVNQKLDELNRYSDRTIYSFSDMTSNIGKFTNAGVKLDDAVAAIQGVSNVAAVSGANANEASRAMYNFAQALSAGHVKLIDWKSIENANMATVEFKNQLLEAAVAAGTVEKTTDGMYQVLTKNGQGGTMKETIDATHMFNDSLAYQWMTTEVLTETLKDYADETTDIGKKASAAAQDVKTWTQLLDTLKESAQSGWAETWQLIAGDYEEAKTTLRDFSEFFSSIIDGSSEARNSLLQGALMSSWGQLKDRVNDTGISVDAFRESLRETAESSVDGLDKMIEEAGSLDATFSKGWLTTDILADTLDNLVSKSAGTKVKISELSDEQLRNIGYTHDQVEALRALSDEAKSSDSNIASLVSTMGRQSGRELLFDSLLNGAKALQGLFGTIKGAWQEIFPPATSEQLYSFIEALHSASERIKDFFTETESGNQTLQDIGNTFKGLFAILDIVKQAFSALWRSISPAGSAVGDLLTGILGLTGSFGKWIVNLDETIKKNDIFYNGIQSVVNVVKNGITAVKEFASAVGDKFGFPSLDEAKTSFKSFLDTVKGKISAPGIEFLSALFDGLCNRARQVRDAIVGMKDGIVESFNKVDHVASSNRFVQVLTGIGTLVREVAGAIGNILGKALDGLINALRNADFNGILDFLNVLVAGGLLASIKKFLNPMEEMKDTFGSFIDWVKGLGGGVTKILDGVRGSLEAWQTKLQAEALGKIAASVAVLSVSLLVLASIDSDKITGSLAAMGTMFGELIASMAILDKLNIDGKNSKKTATAMIKMAAALLILSLAMKNIGEMDPEQVAEGLIAIGVLLAEIDIFLNTAKFDKDTSKAATGIIMFSAAIKILSSAVKSLGSMDWDDMAKGLIGVGVLLAEVEIFLNTAKFNGKTVSTAAGIIILSAAIKVLASACKDFGDMSWGEIVKGLSSIGALLLEITAFTKLTGDAKHVISTGLALIEIGAAMKIFASAVSDFGDMSWEEIGKGLVAMGVALAEVAIATNLMPKNMLSVGAGLVVVGAALKIVASALGSMGGMSWEAIAKGLIAMGGALAELSIALNLMNGTLAGSAALIVAAGALAILTPVLVVLGDMSWESIAKGLIAIAGAFTVIGVAGAVLGPLAPAILAISGALALFGVGAVAIGAGLVLVGAGLTSISAGLIALATAMASSGAMIVAGLSAIVLGFAELIPALAEKIGEAIVAFCGVIADGAPAIGEAVKAVVLSLVDVLVECVPAIADGALQLVTGVLASLVTYTPQIIDSVMQFLIEVLEGIARNIPQLIQAAMDVVGAFFAGVLNALSNIDAESLIKGVGAVGLLTALVAALGLVAGLIPAAMVGVLGMGVVITELALVLAAVGGLAQIPGLQWLIGEGGQLLQTIGNAIGGFVGGIVGGFMTGISSSFPQIGADLSSFMTNVQPFIDGAASIDSSMLSGVKALTEAIILITAADLLEGLTSWLTGGSSLSDFADQLVPFGEAMMEFSNSISGLDGDLVSTAAIAGKTLAEMAATLPNSGGVAGFFAGENDMDEFGSQLVGFGTSMKDFAASVKGLDSDAIQNAAIAGKAMAEMASTLPNTGGAVAFFTGNNDMDIFGEQLVPFGQAIKEYSDAVAGLDVEAVTNSAIAGQALVELANTVPNSGGAVAFFTGENDLSLFGEQLVPFGEAMKEYSETVSGIDGDAVANSATAGAALVELANTIPNAGGLVSFFTGDNDLFTFGEQIVPFGEAMKAYSDSISGIDEGAITASSNAAMALAELQSTLPNVGGVVDFFTGGNDLGTFGEGIKSFGEAMKSYDDSVNGINPEAVTASATAAQALSQLQTSLPNMGGFFSFFTGGNDLSAFSEGIIPFGKAMKEYGDAVSDIKMDSITASATAAQSLAELQSILPSVGGVMEFFTGGNDLGKFSEGLVPFGEAMKEYGNAVAEINTEAITASAIAAQSLAELQSVLPNVGGVMEFFTGGNDLGVFAAGIVPFGEAMKGYGDAVAEINTEAITASAIAAQSLAELQSTLPQIGGVMEFFTGGHDLAAFAKMLIPFGEAMTSYGQSVTGIDPGVVTKSATAGKALVELANTVPNCGGLFEIFTGSSSISSFGTQIIQFGNDLSAYADAVQNIQPEVVTASANAAQALSNLATGLPDSSLFDKWFGGDQTLSSFGKEIVALGTDISDYYSKVAGIDTSKLTGVVTQVRSLATLAQDIQGLNSSGMSSLGKALRDLADSGITEFTSVFSNSATEVNDAVQDMLKSVSASITNGKNLTTPGMESVMKSLAEVVTENATKINNSVSEMMKGVVTTILSSSPSVQAAAIVVVSNAVTAISSMRGQFVALGQNSAQGYINGLYAMRGSVWSAGWTIGNAALQAAKAALDSHSPSREFIYLGQNVGEGFKIGINNGIGPTVKTTSAMMNQSIATAKKGIDAFEDWLDERKYYSEIALKEELAGWEQLQKQYKVGSEERKKIDREVYRVQNEIVKATYQFSIDWIEKEKYYNRLSLKEELAAYERMQKRYMAGSEERKKIDREIYRLKNEIVDAQYQNSLDWIEKEKYYNRLSLEEEYAAWERIQKRYKAGDEEYEKANREKYRLQKEIEDERYQERLDHIDNEVFYGRMGLREELAALEELQKQYEVNSEKWLEIDKKIYSKRKEVVSDFYEKINDYISNEKTFMRMGDVGELGTILRYINQFEEGTDEWKKSMTSAFNLVISIGEAQIQYEKDVAAAESEHAEKRLQMEEEYAEKVKSINKQLEDDIESLNQKYEDAVKSRTDSLYKSYGLFDEVKKKDDVSGDTLITNLKGQVAEFDEWQAKLKSLESKGVSGELIKELQEMGPSSIANVRALNNMTSTQLTQYVNLWSTKHRQAREQATGELEGMRVETQNQIAQLKVDAAKELDEYKATWRKKMNELDASLQEQLTNLRTDFHKSIGLISKYTEEEFTKMATNVSQIMSVKGYNISTNLILGILKGYEEKKPDLLNGTQAVVNGIVQGMHKGLGINSPSRVTYQVGVYTIMGLVNAIKELTPDVFSASAEVAESAKDGFYTMVTTMSDLLDNDMDFQPTIRPVLDLTDLSSRMDDVQSMFMAQRSLELAGWASLGSGGSSKLTVDVDNQNVVSAIGELRSDMAAMADSISQMRIVLDTGATVGALAGPIDSALGRRQVYRGRGN